jgi:hypothetical protein
MGTEVYLNSQQRSQHESTHRSRSTDRNGAQPGFISKSFILCSHTSTIR